MDAEDTDDKDDWLIKQIIIYANPLICSFFLLLVSTERIFTLTIILLKNLLIKTLYLVLETFHKKLWTVKN